MTTTDTDREAQRVRFEVRRFRQHFVTYVAVISIVFVVNLLTGGHWVGHWVFFAMGLRGAAIEIIDRLLAIGHVDKLVLQPNFFERALQKKDVVLIVVRDKDQ